MKQDREQKIHVCRFCKQSFSNGKKLGGHMRGHLALISASKKMGTQENDHEVINGEKGLDVFEDNDQIMKKSDCFDDDYHANGGKQGIQEVINGGDEDVDEMIKESQQEMDIDRDYDADGRKQGIEEVFNGEKVLDFAGEDDEMVKKSQQKVDFDQDSGANVYVLRENPKKSWRVSNSNPSKALAAHKRCHSSKESIKNTVCEKCGKSFDSAKALYGHMRCHSIKRSQPLDESSTLSSSEEHEHDDDDDRVAHPVRKKRSCARYKSPKPVHYSTTLSSSNDDEVENGALCLIMLSRGVRNLDGVELVISQGYSRIVQKNLEYEVSDEFFEFKNKSLEKHMIVESGGGQLKPGRVGPSLVKSKPTKKQKSFQQDFTDSEISFELKRRSKDHKCPICFKEYGSAQGLSHHKRVHKKTESDAIESRCITGNNRLVDVNIEGGVKLIMVQNEIERDPSKMVI